MPLDIQVNVLFVSAKLTLFESASQLQEAMLRHAFDMLCLVQDDSRVQPWCLLLRLRVGISPLCV